MTETETWPRAGNEGRYQSVEAREHLGCCTACAFVQKKNPDEPELSRAVYTAPVNLECGINHGMGQK